MRKACFAALAVALVVGIFAGDVEARPGGRPRGARPGNAGEGPVGQRNLGNRAISQQGPIGQGQFGQNAIGQVGQHKDNPTQIGQGQFSQQQIEQLHKSAQQLQQNATKEVQRQLNSANKQLRNLSGQFKSPTANVAGNAQANVQGRVSQLQTNFKSGAEPFTASWWADHPQAWRYTHPHADAWAVATLGGLGAWLGIAALEDEPYNVYTSETTDEEAADVADQTEQTAANEPAQDVGDFLPLGVFALAPAGAADASGLVQLAVDKQGELRGNYYDVLSGEDAAITGTIDKQTQQAAFKVGTSGNVQLEATLASLTQPQANVTVRFADGQTRDWTLARFDEAAASQQGQPQQRQQEQQQQQQ
jgi:hypothetical protein